MCALFVKGGAGKERWYLLKTDWFYGHILKKGDHFGFKEKPNIFLTFIRIESQFKSFLLL